MYGGGAAAVQPRAWRAFVEHLAPEERGNVLESFYRRLQSPDAAVRDAAVRSCPALCAMSGHPVAAYQARAQKAGPTSTLTAEPLDDWKVREQGLAVRNLDSLGLKAKTTPICRGGD